MGKKFAMRPDYFAQCLFADLRIATSAKIYMVLAEYEDRSHYINRIARIDGPLSLRGKQEFDQFFIVEYDPSDYGARLVVLCDYQGRERVTESIYSKVTGIGFYQGPMIDLPMKPGVIERDNYSISVEDATERLQAELNKLRRYYDILVTGKPERLTTMFAPDMSAISTATEVAESTVRGFFNGRAVSESIRKKILQALGVNSDLYDPHIWTK